MNQRQQNDRSDSFPGCVEIILRAYRFNCLYAAELVRDVSSQEMYRSFGPGLENHPAFALGHLVIASALLLEDLGATYDVPAGWDDLFRRTGPGDPTRPSLTEASYPSKDILLTVLQEKHRAVERRVWAAPVGLFDQPIGWRFDRYFPTVGDLIAFMCITHEAMHLAQVAAWRRAAGLESALARL